MSFSSSQVVVRGDAINTVNGNQYNASVMHFSQKTKRECTEYDEYKHLRRGDVYLVKEVHRRDIRCQRSWCKYDCECAIRAQEIIYSVQVAGQPAKFTAVEYQGKEAQEIWDENFRRFSRERTPKSWQLYGLNRSEVPLLLFHNELVPLANFYKKSFWGDIYLETLRKQLECGVSELWLNMAGNLCKGLKGPHIPIAYGLPIDIIIPSTSAEMLREDTCFKFFQSSSLQLERYITSYAYAHYRRTCLNNLFPEPTNHHSPSDTHSHLTLDMFDVLRFDTVYSPSRGAVARWPRGKVCWKMYGHRGLVNQTTVEDGLIRYKLNDPEEVQVSLHAWGDFPRSWLMQSSRILDAHGMSGREEECFIVDPPTLRLSVSNQKPSFTVENLPPMYLFVYRPPLSISELISWKNGHPQTHFWSLDENGRSEMPKEECRRWGIPELARSIYWDDIHLHYWPTHIYTALLNWQVACGFEPTTADWAQSRGYPKLEIIGGKKEEAQFEGVRDWYSYIKKLREQDTELQLGTPVQAQGTGSIPELPLTTPTLEPSPIPVSNLIPERKRKLTPEDSQVGHKKRSAERPKKGREKRTPKKPITTPRRVQ